MATINDPNVAANISRVGEVATAAIGAQHVVVKPIPASVGHYRSSVRFSLIATQAAASRVWEVRNTGSVAAGNLIIPTRLRVSIQQSAAFTADIRDSLQLFKDTGFTAVDTTNTVTPTASIKRAGMSAAPGSAAIRHVTVAGAAAGMTGGTRTPDGGAVAIAEQIFRQTFTLGATGGNPPLPQVYELLDDVNGTHPFVLAQNEGLEIQNEVLLGAAAGITVVVDFSWAEVTAY